jgi:hypothetical protein
MAPVDGIEPPQADLEAAVLTIILHRNCLVGSQGIEPRMSKDAGFTVQCSHQCCSLPILKHTKPNVLEYGASVAG